MAYDLDTKLENVEFRVLRENTFTDRESGQPVPYMQLVVEDGECKQTNISVPKNLWDTVRSFSLKKGWTLTLSVNLRAGSSYSKCTLISIDSIIDSDGQLIY